VPREGTRGGSVTAHSGRSIEDLWARPPIREDAIWYRTIRNELTGTATDSCQESRGSWVGARLPWTSVCGMERTDAHAEKNTQEARGARSLDAPAEDGGRDAAAEGRGPGCRVARVEREVLKPRQVARRGSGRGPGEPGFARHELPQPGPPCADSSSCGYFVGGAFAGRRAAGVRRCFAKKSKITGTASKSLHMAPTRSRGRFSVPPGHVCPPPSMRI